MGSDSLEKHQNSRRGKPRRADGCRVIKIGASQRMGGFARKPHSFGLSRDRSESPNRREIASTVFVVYGYWPSRLAATKALFLLGGRNMRLLAWQPAVTLGVLDLLRRGWLAKPSSEARLFHSSFTEGAVCPPPLFSMMSKCNKCLCPDTRDGEQ